MSDTAGKDIAGHPNPRTSDCEPGVISAQELQGRVKQIREAIKGARATYPLAAKNLEWWLDGKGKRRNVPLAEFDFFAPDCGLPRHLKETHRKVIALGFESGIDGVKPSALGIQGRLRLPASDPRSLQPGRTQTLDWEDSVKARMLSDYKVAPAAELDLSIALGGYTVHSRVIVRVRSQMGTDHVSTSSVATSSVATSSAATSSVATSSVAASSGRQLIEVLSWKVQVCDFYNWIIGKDLMGDCKTAAAPILVPPGVAIPPVPKGAGTVDKWPGGFKTVYVND